MSISSRGKLAAAVVTAMGVIGAMHFLVFSDNARTYEQARSQYESTRDEVNRLGAPKPWPEIYRFQYETINHEIRFQELLREASLCIEQELLRPDGTSVDEHRRLIVGVVWDHVEEIRRMAQRSGNQDRYPFLRDVRNERGERGWHLRGDFPEPVRQSGVAIEDLLDNIRESVTVLENVSEASPLRRNEELNYRNRLQRIGMNPDERDFLEREFGEAVAFAYVLNRIQLVKDAVPRQRRGFQTDDAYNRELFRLFGLEVPDEAKLYFYGKQMATLRQMMEMAERRNVRIDYARLWEMREQYWPPDEEREQEEGAEAGGAMDFDMMMMGGMDPDMMMMMGMDPSMMGMMDPDMMMMMGMDPSMMGGMGPGAAAEDRDNFAFNVPVEVGVVGSNTAVLSFYHEVANLPKMLEMDTFRIDAVPAQDQIRGRSVVKLTAGFHEFLLECQAVEDNILRLLNEKRQIAERPGARELAEAEGFLEVMGDIPSYEGELRPAAEDLTDAPPAGDPGMDAGMDPMMMDPALMEM